MIRLGINKGYIGWFKRRFMITKYVAAILRLIAIALMKKTNLKKSI
jgi:hypothetical protein